MHEEITCTYGCALPPSYSGGGGGGLILNFSLNAGPLEEEEEEGRWEGG